MNSPRFEEFLNSHSFLMVQSKNSKMGETLPWIVCSVGRKILKTPEPQPDETYNYSVNCSFYQHRGRKFVLAEGQQIAEFLAPDRTDKLATQQYIELNEPIRLETYIYIPKLEEFVQADPTYLHRSGIVLLEFDNSNVVYQKCQPIIPNSDAKYFHFASEFALASDAHFLNCLQRGKTQIGCYEVSKGKVRPVIEEEIYQWVDMLYTRPKL